MKKFIRFIKISYKNYTPHRVSEEYFCPQKFLALPSEVSPGKTNKISIMPRKKASDQDELFIVPVRTRITKATADRLEKLRAFSDCHSIGELARRILSGGTITIFHKDASMDDTMEQLVLIRRELKAIGINMNQVTRSYHQSRDEKTKGFYALKLAAQYQEAATRINLLLSLISQLSKKWLAK